MRLRALLDQAEDLLLQAAPQRPRRIEGHELRVEVLLAALVLAAAGAWPVAAGVGSSTTLLLCVVAYVAAARVELYVGAGCALATQLAFVPMLWLLPSSLVPLGAVAGLVLAATPEVPARRVPPERIVTAVGDAAYAFAPAIVMATVGAGATGLPRWGVVLLAFAAQCAFDVLVSVGREALGRRIRPSVQIAVMASVYGTDALLLPLAVAVAERAEHEPLALLAVVPFSVLLGALARDRTRRLDDAVDRLEALEQERHRVKVAIHRTGRSLGARHDRVAMLEIALGTAVDAVAAAAGGARLLGAPDRMVFEAIPFQPSASDADALLQVERAALAGHARATAEVDGWHALGRALVARRGERETLLGAIAVCRADKRFTPDEDVLFAYLAAQAASSIAGIDLYERLQRERSVDDVTGLASRGRFQDALRVEVERSQPVALIALAVDRLDDLTVRHGPALEREVLRAVASVIAGRCRVTDEPARYRADRIGIVLPGSGEEAAHAIADDMRAAVAGLELPWRGTVVRPTASLGVAAVSGRLATREALVWGAEAALSDARAAGGNRVATFGGRAEQRRASMIPIPPPGKGAAR